MSDLTINYVKESAVQVLKKRFKAAQKQLKLKSWELNDFRDFAIKEEHQFDTPEGYEAIRNAWYGRASNVRLTEIIEQLSKKIKDGQRV